MHGDKRTWEGSRKGRGSHLPSARLALRGRGARARRQAARRMKGRGAWHLMCRRGTGRGCLRAFRNTALRAGSKTYTYGMEGAGPDRVRLLGRQLRLCMWERLRRLGSRGAFSSRACWLLRILCVQGQDHPIKIAGRISLLKEALCQAARKQWRQNGGRGAGTMSAPHPGGLDLPPAVETWGRPRGGGGHRLWCLLAIGVAVHGPARARMRSGR